MHQFVQEHESSTSAIRSAHNFLECSTFYRQGSMQKILMQKPREELWFQAHNVENRYSESMSARTTEFRQQGLPHNDYISPCKVVFIVLEQRFVSSGQIVPKVVRPGTTAMMSCRQSQIASDADELCILHCCQFDRFACGFG